MGRILNRIASFMRNRFGYLAKRTSNVKYLKDALNNAIIILHSKI